MSGKSFVARAAFLLFLLGCLPAGQQQQIRRQIVANDKVDVAVYYESLCPDSKGFIIHQLDPAWATFGPYINIKFIPFGKANSHTSSDGAVQFSCQHGPKECLGNRMQSCALTFISDQNKQEQFVTCVMTAFDPTVAGPKCAEEIGLNYGDVEGCYSSSEGDTLQLQAEEDTNRVQAPLAFVPTIVYNNVFDQDKQDESLNNFAGVMCSLVPQAC